MKRLFILTYLIFTMNIFPQKVVVPETEINFQTRNAANSNQVISFEVYPITYQSQTTISYSYENDYGCNIGVKSTGVTVNLKGNVDCGNSGLEYIFLNESWNGGATCGNNSEIRPFVNALYEIKIKVDNVETFKFYLDTRHNSLPNGCDNNCSGNDISIVYFVTQNTVGGAPGHWQDYDDITTAISNGQYYTWWEIRDNDCSEEMSKFNELYMPLLLEPVVQNSSPLIEWIEPGSPDAEEDFLWYDLQRSVNNSQFVSIYQTDNFNETSYLDSDIFWNPNQSGTIIQYRVFAAYYQQLTDVSNYRKINTGTWYLMKENKKSEERGFNLSQNYPNPFNPSTRIYYRLNENGFVSLRVYNVLGKEVAKLLEEYQNAGERSVEFNATNLPGGIYFYRLTINNLTETKQMVLLK
ncbi:MAG TPA: T9SS type A sorting domain-containing protein [Ignavibacteriaceae bacterium]|nr:T9SS type A sorting domain-containing protein [Ignavibacteriaceae bacterium]